MNAGKLPGPAQSEGDVNVTPLRADRALSRGRSFKTTMGNVITLTPPLNLTLAPMDAALDIIDAGLAAEGRAG
jgi:4-aminobutyrate aminotransferase